MSDILQSNNTVHDILISLAETVEDNDVAVFASGGIDSWSVVFSLLEVDKKVHVYSFTLEDRESYDFLKAQELSKLYGLQFTKIVLPISIDILKQDVIKLHKLFNATKKVEYECLWPFMYAYNNVTERTIGSGLCADGYFCISKSGCLHYKNDIDTFRQNYFKNNGSQYRNHFSMADYYDKKLFMPYNSQIMFDFFVGKSWNECNKPRQKQLIYNSFEKQFSLGKLKQHSNLHLGDSGISEHFEKLLTTDMNKHNYVSVTGIYNSINRGEFECGAKKLIEISSVTKK